MLDLWLVFVIALQLVRVLRDPPKPEPPPAPEIKPRLADVEDVQIATRWYWNSPSLSQRLSVNPMDIKYDLYTRNGWGIKGNKETYHREITRWAISRSWYFQRTRPTWFVVHGFKGLSKDPFSGHMADAVIKNGDYNVFEMHWSYAFYPEYQIVVDQIPAIGYSLAKSINELLDFGVDPDQVTIIGFSLGSHVGGVAGQYTKRKLGRVVGVDPAGINYESKVYWKRLDRNSAKLVEVVHTDGKGFGTLTPLGHVDFYPNGGASQPGCIINLICAHERGYELYIEALVRPGSIVGVRCNDYDAFHRRQCEYQVTQAVGAPWNPRDGNQYQYWGKYYLDTNSYSRFGVGYHGLVPLRDRLYQPAVNIVQAAYSTYQTVKSAIIRPLASWLF